MGQPKKTVFRSGLVSISFRKLTPQRVAQLAAANKLETIEWGGDIHVPHGNVQAAREVQRISADAGVGVSAYGSYYRAGGPALGTASQSPAFEAVLESAIELGAPSIRVWAGETGSAAADEASRHRVTTDLKRICDLAAAQQISVSLEYHGGTLTDAPDSALALLKAVDHPNLSSYWQPRHGLPVGAGLSDIGELSPYLKNVHVFHWWPDGGTRLPLSEGFDRWSAYLAKIAGLSAGESGGDRVFSLEFIRNDDLDQLAADAKTLKILLDGALRRNDTPS